MAETKFIKARCDRTGKYYGLEVKKIGTVWKVVNMIGLSTDEARVITSEISQPSFETHTTLVPCKVCRSRKVGGCACTARSCQGVSKYNFQCIYCNQLKIDYSDAVVDGNHREGDVITLSQGQTVKITSRGKPLSAIEVGVGWDPAVGSVNMDVDSSVVVMGPTGWETIYYGAKVHSTGCVVHHGDNLTGEGVAQADDENISVKLDKVPQDRNKLVFVLNIYKCTERHQTLGSVKNMYIKLYDPTTRKPLIQYKVAANLRSNTALIIGIAERVGAGWSFRALGRGSNAPSIGSLAEECDRLYN